MFALPPIAISRKDCAAAAAPIAIAGSGSVVGPVPHCAAIPIAIEAAPGAFAAAPIATAPCWSIDAPSVNPAVELGPIATELDVAASELPAPAPSVDWMDTAVSGSGAVF